MEIDERVQLAQKSDQLRVSGVQIQLSYYYDELCYSYVSDCQLMSFCIVIVIDVWFMGDLNSTRAVVVALFATDVPGLAFYKFTLKRGVFI